MAENLNLSTLDGGVISVAESPEADVPAAGANSRAEADERNFPIFPPEIWKMILEYVKDPISLYNIYQASPFFRTILLKKRVEFLFPAVLKVLMAGDYLRGGKVVGRDVFSLGKDVSHLVLRKVCRSWTHGVDTYLEEQSSGFHLPHSKNVNNRGYFNISVESNFEFRNSDSAHCMSFMRHFEPTHSTPPAFRNPFLGRALSVLLGEKNIDLWNLFALLNSYGEHVRYLKITLEYWSRNDKIHLHRVIRVLQRVLHACPNVQHLSIDGLGYKFLDEIIAASPPRLLQLEAVKLSGTIPNLISSQFLLQNPTILYLELSLKSDFILENRKQQRLPNLKHLKLFPRSRRGIIDIQQIEAPALTTLTVGRPIFDSGGFQYWQEIFRVINKNWSSAQFLTAVNLHLPSGTNKRSPPKILQEGASFRLKLKNLEKLTVTMECPCSLDFVLPAKEKLKWVKIEVRGRWEDLYQKSVEQGMKRQQIQFLGWERKLYESNLWLQLPNLEEIIVEGPLNYSSLEEKMTLTERKECRRYTRKEWLVQNPQ